MKKLLPTLLVALFAIKVNAQTPLTKELNCTEKAVTLRLNLRSVWHPGMVKIGSAQLTNYTVPTQIDYLSLRYNIQRSEALNQSSSFHTDSTPRINLERLLFDRKQQSDFGLHSKFIYKYRDSSNFLYSYK